MTVLNSLNNPTQSNGFENFHEEDDDYENSSSVTILPHNIPPGSFAEKHLLSELERMYYRRKEENDY